MFHKRVKEINQRFYTLLSEKGDVYDVQRQKTYIQKNCKRDKVAN
jgi:hypothetical protein